jgi:hypothetical protein
MLDQSELELLAEVAAYVQGMDTMRREEFTHELQNLGLLDEVRMELSQ